MNFSIAEENQLISSVAKHPILYDRNHEDYRDGLLRENVWETIAQELNKTIEDCKKKWRLVRDGYHRYKKKTNKGLFSTKSKTERHQQMLFLDKYCVYDIQAQDAQEATKDDESRIEVSGFSSIFASCGDEDSSKQKCFTSEHSVSQDEDMIKIETQKNDDDDEDDTEEVDNKANIRKKIQQFQIRRPKRIFNEYKTRKLWNKRNENRQRLFKATGKQKDDDVDLFCRHIAEVLRNLPPVYKAEAKKQLGALVSDYEIMAATGTVPQNSTKRRET